MSKTPYEVRLDVLKLAQEMLTNEQQIEQAAYNAQISFLTTHGDYEALKIATTAKPRAYTEADLLARTENLYRFVKDSK